MTGGPGPEVYFAEPRPPRPLNRRSARLADRKPPLPSKERLDLRPDAPPRSERTFTPPRERPCTCSAPCCPRWPTAIGLPDRYCCATCTARLDAGSEELRRKGSRDA